jgi:hypothetical protein
VSSLLLPSRQVTVCVSAWKIDPGKGAIGVQF